ncbi:uncharacterized protein LOC135680994 [Rhopilema esculentum]|uniref:uncharacterized protein LOC135680994 n=1 Tax=Rhopilema esculentum TaxID=499914 RepID=UPI0031DC45CB
MVKLRMDTKRAFRILILLCECLFHFVICENKLRWEKLSLNGTGPEPNARKDAALAFDPKRSTVVLFGGRSKSEVYSDTWLFDLKQKSWKWVNDTVIDLEIIPGPRFGTVHGTDGDRFIIAFGSRDFSNSLSNEVFQYDFNSSKWSRVWVKTGDPDSRFLANGGVFNGSLFVSHGYGISGILSDVEKLDFRRQTWETLHECVNQYNPVLPHARYAQSSVLLPDRKILMFGGCLR